MRWKFILSHVKKNRLIVYTKVRYIKVLQRSLKKILLWGLFLQEEVDETAKNTTQEKILKLIKDNPSITQTQMANTLRLTRDGISYNIKQMKNNGVIERIGATKMKCG